MNLESYLKTPLSTDKHCETPWLDVGTVEVPNGRVLISDPNFMYQWKALEIQPGILSIQIKLLDSGGQRIVSCLRVAGKSNGAVGEQADMLIVDSAQVGICDCGRYVEATRSLSDEAYEEKLAMIQTDNLFGILHWNEETPMWYFSSGFGDGRYPVRELVVDSQRIGFQVNFVESGDLT